MKGKFLDMVFESFIHTLLLLPDAVTYICKYVAFLFLYTVSLSQVRLKVFKV